MEDFVRLLLASGADPDVRDNVSQVCQAGWERDALAWPLLVAPFAWCFCEALAQWCLAMERHAAATRELVALTDKNPQSPETTLDWARQLLSWGSASTTSHIVSACRGRINGEWPNVGAGRCWESHDGSCSPMAQKAVTEGGCRRGAVLCGFRASWAGLPWLARRLWRCLEKRPPP